jgi:hypothetical protein
MRPVSDAVRIFSNFLNELALFRRYLCFEQIPFQPPIGRLGILAVDTSPFKRFENLGSKTVMQVADSAADAREYFYNDTLLIN